VSGAMNGANQGVPSSDRLMVFDVAGAVYALPIGGVLEVVEQAGVSCVPTVARDHCGIMNWHGEALPVVAPHLLLGGDPVSQHTRGQIQQYLVVSGRPDASVPLGLPIDFVSGLVDGEPGRPHDNEVVVERRSVNGRVVRVIDPQRLVARAAEVIERSAAA
jgi:chemotaxis signal transduction protein